MDQHFVRSADQAEVLGSPRLDHAVHPCVQIQLSRRLRRVLGGGAACDDQVAHGKIGLRPGHAEHGQLLLGGGDLALREQLPGAGERVARGHLVHEAILVDVRRTRPQRRLVQGEPCVLRIPPGHRGQAAVAERECFEPASRRSTADEGAVVHRVIGSPLRSAVGIVQCARSIHVTGWSNTGFSAARAAPCRAGSARVSARWIATGPASAARAWASTVCCTTGVISSAIGAR